jgi:hypothetical protein
MPVWILAAARTLYHTPDVVTAAPLIVALPVLTRVVATTVSAVAVPVIAADAAVSAPATVAVVPTHRAFWDDIPPAVMIEPVVELVASVVSVELTPSAKGMRAVVAVCPSFVIAVLRPVARSAVRALNAVLVIVVPVTTG